ncbi:MAG: hypothetical protein KBB83_05720 [Alphaproteobacteria bacterium]|nr:hypothetical protein [Alphaproteobacteria bacterium]
MNCKIMKSAAILLSLGFSGLAQASWPEADENLPKAISAEIDGFSESSLDAKDLSHVFVNLRDGRTYYGLYQTELEKANYAQLKAQIAQNMGLKTNRLVQVVGSSKPFSVEGTRQAREFLTPFLAGDHIIEYGFTGHVRPAEGKLDINSFVSEYIENNPRQAFRVLANIVGHSVVALEKWGCKGQPRISHYVVVFNEHGMKEGFTKFGDDVVASDFIMSKDSDDLLVVIEGGWQSFKQSLNALSLGIKIEALANVREESDKKLFSTAELFHIVKQAMTQNPDMSKGELVQIFTTYMDCHEAWDKTRPDAETKEALYKASVEQFLNSGVYKKILTHVNTCVASNNKI